MTRAWRGLREDAMERLLEHSWPGNVREMENVLRKACCSVRER